MDPIDRIRIDTVSLTIWLAGPDGLTSIDTVAVERVINGDDSVCLTDDEIQYAASVMARHGMSYGVIAARLGVCTKTLARWAKKKPPRRVPRALCGTRSGYQRHRSLKERACDPCKAAAAAADRYYRLHGTYRGAPGEAWS